MISARRSNRLVFPIVLVVGGALILLANLGSLPEGAGWRVLQLWPLILVMVGVQILVPHLFNGTAVPAVTLLLVGAIAAGGFAYVVAGPSLGSASYTRVESSAPSAGVTAGTITVDAAGAQVNIRAGDVGDNLYVAKIDYTGSAPRISYSDGDLHISTGQNNFFNWGQTSNRVDITLSAAAEWSVKLNGAGTNAKVDFGNGSLRLLSLNGVGATATVLAGEPKGTVPMELSGVGTSVTLSVTAGCQYRVTAKGVGTSVDGARQTAGWETSADRYDISANGVGAHVTVRVSG